MGINTPAKKILILAANPKGTSPLRLDEELRDISEGLQRSQNRNQFTLEHRLAVRPRDIQRAMLDVNPQIVHFSGHGAGEEGLVFEDETGKMKLVESLALAELFELFSDQVECVVLNGCHSLVQEDAIVQYINYVIGMSQAIGDKAAIEFAVGFYDALGAGRSIDFAYKLGCSSIRLSGIPGHLIPTLKKKTDSSQLISDKDDSRTEWMLVLSGTFNDTAKEKVEALVEHLRQLSGDASLTLKKIKAGSIVLILEGSPESFRFIESLWRSGELTELMGIPIENIDYVSDLPKSTEIFINTDQSFSTSQSRYSKFPLDREEVTTVETGVGLLFRTTKDSPILIEEPQQRKYYIDFSSVRFGETINEIERTIINPTNETTCQVLTGHIGCGKSTELLRLKWKLEREGFHVIYLDASEDLDLMDIDGRDLLLAIARQITTSLESLSISFASESFAALFAKLVKNLSEIEIATQLGVAAGTSRITSSLKLSPSSRQQFRQYLELQEIVDAINNDLLKPGITSLKQSGKKGLVVIVDELDRAGTFSLTSNEDLFIDQGEFLRKLNCHLIFTMPLSLKFSNEYNKVVHYFGEAKLLPLIPLQYSDGHGNEEALSLLKQVVLARAYPDLTQDNRLEMISNLFDTPANLNTLCQLSGGHLRTLLTLFRNCLVEDLPISRKAIERVVRQRQFDVERLISDNDWALLSRISQQRWLSIEEKQYQSLLINRFVLEYLDNQGNLWYRINPILADAQEIQV